MRKNGPVPKGCSASASSDTISARNAGRSYMPIHLMPVSNALKRLLRIRDLEQEQHRRALESALSELRRLEDALERASVRERGGRSEFAAGVLDQNPQFDQDSDQESHAKPLALQSALVETAIGQNHAQALAPRISRATAQAALRQREFLLKRMERRQAETLIRETEATDAIEATRQGQKNADDWFLARSRSDRRDSALSGMRVEEFEESSNLPPPE